MVGHRGTLPGPYVTTSASDEEEVVPWPREAVESPVPVQPCPIRQRPAQKGEVEFIAIEARRPSPSNLLRSSPWFPDFSRLWLVQALEKFDRQGFIVIQSDRTKLA